MAMMDSLSALNGLTSNVRNPRNPMQGYLDRKSRIDELKRNLALTGLTRGDDGKVTSGFASGATPTDVATLQDDVNEDPDFGVEAQNRTKRALTHNEEDVRYKDPNAVGQRKDALAEALAKAEAPAKAAGAASLAVEHEKNRGLMDVLGAKQKGQMDLLDRATKGGGGGSVSEDPYGGFNISVGPNGVSLKNKTMPQTVAAQQEAAGIGLSQIPGTRQMLDSLDKMGAIGPVQGRMNTAATTMGLDPMAEMLHLTPSGSARQFNDFKAQLDLVKSNLGKVHFGNRASAAIGAKFDKLLNPHQSAQDIRGGLDAAERWLTKYANAKSSAELDAANAELGVTGGAYERPASDDLGSDF